MLRHESRYASGIPRVRCGVRPKTGRRAAFSVVELLIVLVLVGLIAGMAVPRLNYERFRADGAMRKLRGILQLAQRNAIMRQTNIVVAFDVSAGRLQVLEDADNDCVVAPTERRVYHPLEEGARYGIPPVGITGPVPAAVMSTDPCAIQGLPTIQFLRDGAASTELQVYLTSSRGDALDFRLVRVTPATGRAQTFRFDGAAWRRTN